MQCKVKIRSTTIAASIKTGAKTGMKGEISTGNEASSITTAIGKKGIDLAL
jgi:hypothetical protein